MKKLIYIFVVIILSFVSDLISAKEYKGAEYRTIDEFKYGRFDVRFKPANREGVVSSFFTFHEFSTSTADWGELDVEIVGRYKNNVQFNAITPYQTFHIRSNYVEFDPYIEFHEYGFEWTPDYVAWFIDGEEVFRQTGEHVATLIHPQTIMMNIWNPIYTNWVGYFDDSFLPTVSTYDWVQYSAYTNGTGNYGSDNNFTVEWKDEFETFDESRWEKATHSFNGNQADFIEENVVIDNGYLKLFLTNNDDLGDVDNILPNIVWARANYDKSITIQFSEEIEKNAAEDLSNYILSGVTILSAELSLDNRIVHVITENYDPFISTNLIVKNITENKPSPNIKAIQAVTINNISPLTYPVKVNVGGDAYNDYLADQEWGPTVEYGHYSGRIINHSVEIAGTDDDYVFQTDKSGINSYKFKVPNGVYNLEFLFAENDNNRTGTRTFNIIAEGKIIESDLDVYSRVGENTMYSIKRDVNVEDEVIDIYFEQNVDSTFINAIILNQISTGVNDKQDNLINDNFKLFQNYPNPFNGITQIQFILNQNDDLSFEIFDSLGRQIYSNYLGETEAGAHSVEWGGLSNSNTPVSSGVYYYKFKGNNFSHLKKLVYIK